MQHEKYQRMAIRRADNALDEKGVQELHDHLSVCLECSLFVEDIGLIKEVFAPLAREEVVNGALNTFMSSRAVEAAEKATLLGLIREIFFGRQNVLRYAGLALILGALAGGAGFYLQKEDMPPSYLSVEEEALFSTVYPGSITDVLNTEGDGSL